MTDSSARSSPHQSDNGCSSLDWIQRFRVNRLRPLPWVGGPNLQTQYAFFLRRAPRVPYSRQSFETSDGDRIDIDTIDQNPKRPLIIACHGLEGSSRSKYIRRLMKRCMIAEYGGIALNHRTCSGEANRTIRTYHYGFIDDLDQIVTMVTAAHPERPVLVVGYSLGGSIVANWLGRRAGVMPPGVCGAAAISAPLDAGRSVHSLDEGMRFYGRHFLSTMRRKVKMLSEEDKTAMGKALDHDAIRQAKTMEEFETRYTAPAHGYPDLDSYYENVSAARWLGAINVPMLVLHARDDPVIPFGALPRKALVAQPFIRFIHTGRGGHVGFVSRSQNQWLEDQLLRWFDLCLQHAQDRRTSPHPDEPVGE